MVDEQNEQAALQEPGKEQPISSMATSPTQQEYVDYARFKEVNDALKELREWKANQEATLKAAADKQLAEQQKWQELAEKREQELRAIQAKQMRTEIALRKSIPADLIDRLKGETEEEIAADADRLLAYIKPTTGPGVPPASRGGQPVTLDISRMSPEEIRKHSAELTKQAFR